ncbi:MAG TPA: hypothetical protein DCE56_10920 [Cyanobacteria bacterium UBA8553]|nr:hypothetical protein [Cyanobacteria bacterium UBA8553]
MTGLTQIADLTLLLVVGWALPTLHVEVLRKFCVIFFLLESTLALRKKACLLAKRLKLFHQD